MCCPECSSWEKGSEDKKTFLEHFAHNDDNNNTKFQGLPSSLLGSIVGWPSCAWVNGSLVSQERGLGAEISYEILQKEVTKRSLCQLGIQSSMNTTFCFCHCITVALALGRLRLMWLSHQALCGAPVLLLSFLIWWQGCVGLLLIKAIWVVLAHTKLLCRTGLPRLVFVFLFGGWEPSAAIVVLWAFGSLSTSEAWALSFQHQEGFAPAEGRVLTNDHCIALCISCEKSHPWASYIVAHTLQNIVFHLEGGEGGCYFSKWTKKCKKFWFLKVWKAWYDVMSWELHVLIILRFFFFVLSKLLLFTLKEEVVGAVWVHILY